jgi:hypothetical protein
VKVGVIPVTGLLEPSIKVIVIVEKLIPSGSIGEVPVIEELFAETGPTVPVNPKVTKVEVPWTVAVTVFGPATAPST